MLASPREVSPGDRIRAEDINAIVRVLERVISVEPPLEIRRDAGGGITLGLRLDLLLERMLIPCRIVEAVVGGAGLDQDGTARAGDVSYRVQPFGRTSAAELTRAPDYGRPVTDDAHRIVPASAGDPCLVWRWPVDGGTTPASLWVLTETVARRGCG